MPARRELPDTIACSPKKAQRTWLKAHDSAGETYGEGERAGRKLGVRGRSRMRNEELARAIARKQR